MKTLLYRHGKCKKEHKHWEFQIYTALNFWWNLEFTLQHANSTFTKQTMFYIDVLKLLTLNISNSRNQDHAGFRIELNVLGMNFDYSYYDERHWDDENNKWEE